MTGRLALRSDVLLRVEADGVAIASDRAQYVLLGTSYAVLVPLLNGTLSEDEILARCGDSLGVQPALTTIRRLRLHGLLEEGDWVLPAGRTVSAEPASAGRTSGPPLPSVSVDIIGGLDAHTWVLALERRGFPIEEAATIRIALTDSYLRPRLCRLTEEMEADLLLLVRPVGSEVWLGPSSGAGDGTCFSCLQRRFVRNRPVEDYLLTHQGRSPSVLHPAQPDRVASIIAEAILTGPDPVLTSAIRTIDLATGSTSTHFLPAGACPHRAADKSIRAQPGPLVSPDLEDCFDPLTGVVHGLRRVETDVPTPVHTFEATFSGRPTGPGLVALRRSLKSAWGKGWTDAQGRTSALGEAVERFCAVFRGDEARVWATFDELGDKALHPNACQLFSDAQFAGRDSWNRRNRRFNQVPRPFDPHARCEWSPVRSLTRNRELLLPTALLYDDYPQRDDDAFAWFDPNGTSAGPTHEGAVLGGLLELIERDAVAIWWYNRLMRPKIAHEAPEIGQLCRSLGREYWVLNLTTDLGIPVFAAISRRTDLPTERPLFGFGCHTDGRVALQKALLEMVQVIALVRDADRGPKGVGLELESWLRTASVDGEPYLAPSEETPSTRVEALEQPLLSVQEILEAAGLEILELDLTRADVGLPVVTIIVPGLRSFYTRFAPGRLFDVPVSLGWLREPTRESILSATPFLL